jgi:hypothetical protein
MSAAVWTYVDKSINRSNCGAYFLKNRRENFTSSYLRTSGRIGGIRWLVTIDTLQWLPILKKGKKRRRKKDEFSSRFLSLMSKMIY